MFVDALLALVALAVAVPAAVFAVECLVGSLLPARRHAPGGGDGPGSVVVLIPAHDEEAGLGQTLDGLLAALPDGGRVLVVADNCSDGTAEVARGRGVEVFEREDPARRGKGYAIEYGLAQLEHHPPDVVVLVDADCRVAPGALARIAGLAHATDRPVQAEYLMRNPADPSPAGAVSALAVLVRNRVRPRGLDRLAGTCQLTGSGMAFSWQTFRLAPETGSDLVEDMVMGLELARRGRAPLLCADASVEAALPERSDAARTQRTRWEHGHLATIRRFALPMVVGGVLRGSWRRVGLGLDLLVPPLALLTMLTLLVGALCAVWCLLFGGASAPAWIALGALAGVVLGTLVAWAAHGRREIPARVLLLTPLYLLWKIPVYLAAVRNGIQRDWVRTERS